MSDKFNPMPLGMLYRFFTNKRNLEAVGLIDELQFSPVEMLKTSFINKPLDTPFGVAAGPHTQMSQNIITAWLSGARYIELKTVQVLDELEIVKPCIDMADEGYNCEWSQELKIEQSFDEYLNAWILIHVLHHKLFDTQTAPGVIFNMSLGYNYDGIQSPKIKWFVEKMQNCAAEKATKINELLPLYPEILNIQIPDCISDNVTLSTMHGCPADEIEKISFHLIEDLKLNTILKLNPTLLGKDEVRHILNDICLFEAHVPDFAFEHDLKYDDAVSILKVLKEAAKKNNLFFGVKLTNTLECLNKKNVFPKEQETMYMSGRALHPISINLALKLQKTFNGQLDISFSAGADCYNIADILSCGLYPVTVSSDLLKPGGYGRLLQYAENIQKEIHAHNASSLDDFIKNKGNTPKKTEACMNNLHNYAPQVLENTAYKRDVLSEKNIKTGKKLSYFDCISAPCTLTCPTNQDIPEYLYHSSNGDFNKAFQTILRTNPFPNVLGMVCDHKCQSKCTRINYDDDVRIRDVKWYVSENSINRVKDALPYNGMKVAVIGAGPSGLSCAYFLRLAGIDVTVYESKSIPGGMVSEAIPHFRLKEQALLTDIERIKSLGVHIHYNAKIDIKSFERIKEEYNYIYIAVGAQKIKQLNIEGDEAHGVVDPIVFLSAVKRRNIIFTGKNVAVIGGGNTAMDVARTVSRLLKGEGSVTVVYRRTVNEMPADKEEVEALLNEGIEVLELTSPLKVVSVDNKVTGLLCNKMKIDGVDAAGRARPVPIENSDFILPLDTIIPALGQEISVDFLEEKMLKSPSDDNVLQENIYIGGDAFRGASTVVNAVADGKKAAIKIVNTINYYKNEPEKYTPDIAYNKLMNKRALRVQSVLEKIEIDKLDTNAPEIPFTEDDIVNEAKRCLSCDVLCNICVTVCPNKANYSYRTKPATYNIYKLTNEDGEIKTEIEGQKVISQQYQIINIADFCNECGNCNTFCPTSGAPYQKKPKFCLTAESFNETTNAFMLNKQHNKLVLIYKEEGNYHTLTYNGQNYVYENEAIKAVFDFGNFNLQEATFVDSNQEPVTLSVAVDMRILIDAAIPLY